MLTAYGSPTNTGAYRSTSDTLNANVSTANSGPPSAPAATFVTCTLTEYCRHVVGNARASVNPPPFASMLSRSVIRLPLHTIVVLTTENTETAFG